VSSLRSITVMQVHAFVAAATANSFTSGAAALGLTQPALSKCIKDLESALETTLFVRAAHGVGLSDAGRAVLPCATQLLARHEELLTGMAAWHAARSNTISVAGSYAVMPIVLPTLLRMLNAEFGDARVQMEEVASDVVARRVLSGQANIGVGAVLCEHPALLYTPLLEAQFGLVVTPDFPLPTEIRSLDDLRDVPFVRFNDDALITTALRAHGIEFEAYFCSRVVVDSVGYAYNLAREGNVAALMTGIGANRNKDGAMRFVPLPGLLPSVTVSLFTRQDSHFDAQQEVIKELICDSVLNTAWHSSVRPLRRASGRRKTDRAHKATESQIAKQAGPLNAPVARAQVGFRKVKVFETIAKCKNIQQAAQQLHVTPSGLSKIVRELEASLRVQLFTRSPQGVALTEGGVALLSYAQRLSRCIDDSLAQLRTITTRSRTVVAPSTLDAQGNAVPGPEPGADQGGIHAVAHGLEHSGFTLFASVTQQHVADTAPAKPRATAVGSIRITVGTLLAREMMSEWLANYVVTHPGITLHLLVNDDRPDLGAENIDIALRPGPLADPKLSGRLLATARRVACASPAYLQRMGSPASPQDLVKHNCLVHRSQNSWLDEWEFTPVNPPGTEPIRVKVPCTLVCDDASVAYQWALQGRGIIYNSELSLKRALASGSLVRLLNDHLGAAAPLYAVHLSSRGMTEQAQDLLDQLAIDFGRESAGQALRAQLLEPPI
jgi:DNA-binding transcriptional LysR family regulator